MVEILHLLFEYLQLLRVPFMIFLHQMEVSIKTSWSNGRLFKELRVDRGPHSPVGWDLASHSQNMCNLASNFLVMFENLTDCPWRR